MKASCLRQAGGFQGQFEVPYQVARLRRRAVESRKYETMLLPVLTRIVALRLLGRQMCAKCGDQHSGQGELARTRMGFRLHQHRLAPKPLQRYTNPQRLLLQINVLPAKPQRLATTQP